MKHQLKVSPSAVLSAGQVFKVSTLTFRSAANDFQALCMMYAISVFAMTAPEFNFFIYDTVKKFGFSKIFIFLKDFYIK